MKFLYVVVVILQVKLCENANILGIAPLIGRSHFVMFESLFKGLAARGHNVDVVSHFPLKEKVQRYNDIPIKGNFVEMVNNMTVDFVVNRNIWSTINLLLEVGGPNMCKDILESKTLKHLRNTTKKYDLLITEFFANDCMLGFSHLFEIPVVTLTTSVALPWTSYFIGFPDNPSYIPNYFAPYEPQMTLRERVINTGIYMLTKIRYDISSVKECNVYAKRFFGPDLPDLGDLARNVSLLLVNSHFSVHMSRPMVPNFIEVAGLHIQENYTLPDHFQESLKTDLKGTIYLSFGSMLLTESFPEHKLRGLFEAFRKIPYKILWKATREKFPKNLEIPPNIQFESWMPQLAILCHPNVKVFVSHGGMMSTLEAMHCGVPVLGIPIFADQMLNIQTNAARGFATYVSYENITEESISEALKLLLGDPSYRENVKQASTLYRDRPATAMETAVFWIEYVIRHKGARHLRTIGSDLAWYQYLLIDVILIYFATAFVLAFLLYYILACLYQLVFGKLEKIKQH